MQDLCKGLMNDLYLIVMLLQLVLVRPRGGYLMGRFRPFGLTTQRIRMMSSLLDLAVFYKSGGTF
jgi:hypothetical protein